jgi:hypothetical protein
MVTKQAQITPLPEFTLHVQLTPQPLLDNAWIKPDLDDEQLDSLQPHLLRLAEYVNNSVIAEQDILMGLVDQAVIVCCPGDGILLQSQSELAPGVYLLDEDSPKQGKLIKAQLRIPI